MCEIWLAFTGHRVFHIIMVSEKFYNINTPLEVLFSKKVTLLPTVNELFELHLAYLEYSILAEKDYLSRTAYGKSKNGKLSKHFLAHADVAKTVSKNRSTITNLYFQNGQFSTGYATHSLFPYRGKFHPQLRLKGLLMS